jgi:quinol monooxygenase YgiN
MTTIVANSRLMTSATVFTVEPEHQQELIDILVTASEMVRRQPGFISLNIHKSFDGTQVLSYSQWENHEAFENALQNAAVIPFVQAILKLASFEPHFYDVVAVIEADKAADKGQAG